MRFYIYLILYFIFSFKIIIGNSVDYRCEKIAKDFFKPLWIGNTKGFNNKLWVIEQSGKIFTIDNNKKFPQKELFLDLTEKTKIFSNEQGLLGMAFSPNYKTDNIFFVYYTNLEKDVVIAKLKSFKNNPLKADISSLKLLIEIYQDYNNHNGGWLEFGPDNMLYIGVGDGGAGNDPKNYAQQLNTLKGKILRIDVLNQNSYKIPTNNPFYNKKNVRKEIISYGLRNPWRCSWDLKSKMLFIADVGQNRWEEINYISLEKLFGANFAWRLREGNYPNPRKKISGPPPSDNINPIYSYKHGSKFDEGHSVAGGYLYRGSVKSLQNHYIFADYVNPKIWAIDMKKYQKTKNVEIIDLTKNLFPNKKFRGKISSFGIDQNNELFFIDHKGPIYKIISKKI